MRVTTKGQVTIPQEIRERLGILPHSEVEFDVVGDSVRIRKKKGTQDPRSAADRAHAAGARADARDDHRRADGADARRGLMTDARRLQRRCSTICHEDEEWFDWSSAMLAKAASAGARRHQSDHLRRGVGSLSRRSNISTTRCRPTTSSARRCRGRRRFSPARRSRSTGGGRERSDRRCRTSTSARTRRSPA